MINKKTLYILAAVLATTANADDGIPHFAQLTHETDLGNFLTIDCAETGTAQIECQITQATLSKSEPVTGAQLAAIQQQAAADPKNVGLGDVHETCEDFATKPDISAMDDHALAAHLVDIAQRKGDPIGPHLAHEASLDEARKGWQALDAVCQYRNYNALIDFTLDIERRSCRLSVMTPSVLSFNYDAAADVWISEEEVADGCAARNIVTLRQEIKPGYKDFKTWRYERRRVVGNPSGTSLLGLSCSELPTNVAVWNWQPAKRAVGCDFIGTQ